MILGGVSFVKQRPLKLETGYCHPGRVCRAEDRVLGQRENVQGILKEQRSSYQGGRRKTRGMASQRLEESFQRKKWVNRARGSWEI